MSSLWWGHPHSVVVVVVIGLERGLFGDTGGEKLAFSFIFTMD